MNIRSLVLAALLALIALPVQAQEKGKPDPWSPLVQARGSVRVKRYTTKSGKYVAPHVRSAPDRSKTNNWSSKGSTNPYTGKRGTRSAR